MRSDLEDPDGVLLAIRAAHNAKTHRHFDLTSFILRAGGRGLIIDAGHPTYSARYWGGSAEEIYERESLGHNCILVDGVGQKSGEEYRAQITRFQDDGAYKVLCVDMQAEAMGIKLHRREISLSLAEDGQHSMSLRDEVHLDRAAEVTWLFHFDPDAEAELDGNGATIVNGPARLTICFSALTPLETTIERDYPVPFLSVKATEVGESYELMAACEISHSPSPSQGKELS